MHKVALSVLLVWGVYLLAVPASWAQQQKPAPAPGSQAPQLYLQCQDQLKKDPNEDAKRLCDEGMKQFREGKQEEAIKTIQEGLGKFK